MMCIAVPNNVQFVAEDLREVSCSGRVRGDEGSSGVELLAPRVREQDEALELASGELNLANGGLQCVGIGVVPQQREPQHLEEDREPAAGGVPHHVQRNHGRRPLRRLHFRRLLPPSPLCRRFRSAGALRCQGEAAPRLSPADDLHGDGECPKLRFVRV